MIKRYTPHIYEEAGIPAMAEHVNGSYVRYDDVADLLVDKTVEQHRAEFERSVERHYSVYWCDRGQSYMSLGGLQALIYQSKWQGWLAAKGVEE